LLIVLAFLLPAFVAVSGESVYIESRGKPASPPGQDKPGDEDPTDPPTDPPAGDGVVNKYALVIGISDYASDANDLTYCDEDAQDWKNYLQGEGYQVDLLLDRQATAQAILDAFVALGNHDGDDMIAITYSGHGYYSRSYRDSGLVSTDEYLILSADVKSITDTYASGSVFMFLDCCNIGKYEDLVRTGWVAGIGSTTRTYTYDGTSDMQNGIYTYYAMEAIGLGYFTAEDIAGYAAQMFNSATPGKASTIDMFSGDLDL
jgi:hypothetical protein